MAKRADWHPTELDVEEMRRHAAEVLAGHVKQRGYLTYDAFLDMADEDTLAEWVDGTIVMTSRAKQPLPDSVAVLLEIDGEAYARYLREQLRRAGL